MNDGTATTNSMLVRLISTRVEPMLSYVGTVNTTKFFGEKLAAEHEHTKIVTRYIRKAAWRNSKNGTQHSSRKCVFVYAEDTFMPEELELHGNIKLHREHQFRPL